MRKSLVSVTNAAATAKTRRLIWRTSYLLGGFLVLQGLARTPCRSVCLENLTVQEEDRVDLMRAALSASCRNS